MSDNHLFNFRKCPEILGGNDKNKWEDIILTFLRANQVKVFNFLLKLMYYMYCHIWSLVLHCTYTAGKSLKSGRVA